MTTKDEAQSSREFACTYFGSILGECSAWQEGPVFSYEGCGMYCAALITADDELMAQISDDLPNNIRLQLIGYCAEQGIPYEGNISWPWPDKKDE